MGFKVQGLGPGLADFSVLCFGIWVSGLFCWSYRVSPKSFSMDIGIFTPLFPLPADAIKG